MIWSDQAGVPGWIDLDGKSTRVENVSNAGPQAAVVICQKVIAVCR